MSDIHDFKDLRIWQKGIFIAEKCYFLSRLTLGSVAKKKNYRVMINELGQVLSDPIINIPEKEIWLWKNQSALESLKRGVNEVTAEETQDLGSFAEYAELDIDD